MIREDLSDLRNRRLLRAHSAAALVGCDEKTVKRYVALRDSGCDVDERERRARLIDSYLAKIEELVDKSSGQIRADVVHERLQALGFAGTDRTTRRAVAEAKQAYTRGHRRRYRPWLPEPGYWLQFDWGEGPKVAGRHTQLFCVVVAVAVSGGVAGVGSAAAHLDRLPGHDGAADRRRPSVSADRQPENGDDRPDRRYAGAPPRRRRGCPALRLRDAHVRAVRPGVQGRCRAHRQDREGGSGTDRGESVAGICVVRGAGGGLLGLV
jgi:hypothetical protein